MKIVKIETIPYSLPIKKFADAYTPFDRSNAVLVKIHTDDGIIGIGEACAWEPEFYGETLETITTIIDKYLSPKLIGENPLDIHRLLTIVDSNLAKVTCVKEGIDLALFDLMGKALKVPVYTLLNGKFRDRIPIASEIGIDEPEAMVENALRVLELGIPVIKIKGSSDYDLDIDRIKAVRKAVGDSVKLRLDPNAAWQVNETIRVMRELDECKLEFLEQPVYGKDLNSMAWIRQNINIPLMADESIWDHYDVISIFEKKAADIVNIKIAKSSGLLGAKKIEHTSEAVGLVCLTGTEIEPGMSLAAKIHLAASIKNLHYACEFTELSLLEESILFPEIKIDNGYIKVPDSSGFGFEINEDILDKYKVKF